MYLRGVVVFLLLVSLPATVATGGAPSARADVPAADAPPAATADAAPSSAGNVRSPASASTASNASNSRNASAADPLVRTLSLALTPADPGSIEARVRFQVPDRVSGVTVAIPDEATVTSTRGFSRAEGNEYEWDGRTSRPAVTFDHPANETGETRRAINVTGSEGGDGGGNHVDGSGHYEGGEGTHTADRSRVATHTHLDGDLADAGYVFVDTGDWAVVRVPQLRTGWNYRGEDVTLDRRTVVDGDGATGGEVAFLGPSEEHVREVDGQRIRLIVPEAASMAESPGAVLDSLDDASGRLRVGARDEVPFFVAAPTTTNWAARGLQFGPDDAWVLADSRLASPDNVWIHEYVHTRQAYQTTAETQWLIEGGAEYYAALYAFEQGRIDFRTFRDHLRNGERSPYAGSVLADPTTWQRTNANYVKGALAVGAVDYHARVASDRRRNFGVVFRRLNEYERVTSGDFYDAVNASGGPAVRERTREFVETDTVPTVWSAADHAATFDSSPAILSASIDSFRVDGPSRNRTVTAPPTLVPGERLTATVSVENDGGRTGEFAVAMTVDGERVAARHVTLDPGERAAVVLATVFDRPGTYRIEVEGTERTVEVRESATPAVTDIRVDPASPTAGESVRLIATVSNGADRPADGDVAFRVDGQRVALRSVALDVDEEDTVTANVTLPSGEVRVSAGDAERTVDVAGKRTVDTPGFGAMLAALAILATALLLGRSVR